MVPAVSAFPCELGKAPLATADRDGDLSALRTALLLSVSFLEMGEARTLFREGEPDNSPLGTLRVLPDASGVFFRARVASPNALC